MTTATLGDVVTVRSSLAGPKRPENSLLSHVGPEHIQSGSMKVEWSEVRSCADDNVKSGKYVFEPGDILYSKIRPYLNKLAPADRRGMCSADMYALVADEGRVSRDYLMHWMSGRDFLGYVMNASGRARMPKVNRKQLLDAPIPLPPLPEQRRIAGILDAADALRRRRRRTIETLDTLQGALFAEMFGSPENLPAVPFADLLTDLQNGVSPSKNGLVQDEVLTLTAITGSRFDPTFRKRDTFAKSIPEAKRVKAGDFLLCRGNGNGDLVAKGWIATKDGEGIVYPDTVMRARLDDDLVSPGYFQVLWGSPFIRRQINRAVRTTNGTMKINQKMLGDVMIALSNLDRQRTFERCLAEFAQPIRTAMTTHLAHLETLFAALQSRAFAGDL